MRLLVGIRQSRAKELSESPESQRRDVTEWAGRNGHQVIGEAADIGVSASVSPFQRKNLGPWLTDPHKLAKWDVLGVWKIDRAVRDSKHFWGELVPELERLGKKVISVTEGVDTTTTSATELGFRVGMAQDELQKLKDRAARSRKALRDRARWPGGTPPFGYYATKTPSGVKLAIDTEAMEAIHAIIDMLRDGHNLNQCLRWLTQEEILTAWDRHAKRVGNPVKKRRWRWRTLDIMLRSRHLLGQMTHDGDVIRDEEGNPRQFGEPLMTRQQWDELQSLLEHPKQVHRRSNGSMLRHVVYCSYCGSSMHYRPDYARDVARYYCSTRSLLRDRACFEAAYPATELEDFVEEKFLQEYGDREIIEVEATPVVDHSSRLTEISEALDQLETDRYIKGRFKGDDGARRFDRLYAKLESERDELLAVSPENQGIQYIHTGKTYREAWEAATPDERGDLLRHYGVVAMAQWRRRDLTIPLDLMPHVHIYFPFLDRARLTDPQENA